MNGIAKNIAGLSMSLVLSAAGLAGAAEKAEPQKAPAEGSVVAKVNGVTITKAELDRAVKSVMSQGRQQQPLDAESMKKAETAVRDQMVATELLYQAGQKNEVKDLEKQLDEKFEQTKKRFPSGEEYEKALKQNEIDEKQLRENIRKDLVITALLEKEVTAKVSVPDADVKKFYETNADKFKKPESVRASHILIGVDAKATDEEKKKAKEKAEALLQKVKKGEDFAALAKTESSCPSSAQGGDLGEFGRGQMVPPFEKAAFEMKPGETSNVVETQFGYHIIKLTEKKDAGAVPFDQVKDKIRDYLKNQESQKKIGDYIAGLKKDAKVELADLSPEPTKETKKAEK
jgi:peptidyl-prolyl cis-trans isomerase C